ncbi:RNA recognition motif domain-containing protein [Ditylenchus destructor]|nr:RNA recognition motif domain-containing protein [Ditylenchus destructor]
MIARSRIVGNFLSHSRVQRQLTKVVGLSQSVPLQSTNDNSEKNITLKLPPNATGVSVEHSNETSPDGNSLRAMLNISVLQSNKSTPESEQSRHQFKTVNRTYSTVETKYQYHRELKVTMKQRNEILINGLSKNVLEDDLRTYFSRFGEIETCAAFVDWGYVTFKSYNAVNQVLKSGPHYIVGDRITNENQELFALNTPTNTFEYSRTSFIGNDLFCRFVSDN